MMIYVIMFEGCNTCKKEAKVVGAFTNADNVKELKKELTPKIMSHINNGKCPMHFYRNFKIELNKKFEFEAGLK